MSIDTYVSTFTSPSAADAYLTRGIAVATQYAGKDVGQTPLHLDEVGVNAVRGLGERAASLTEVSRFGDARLYSTSIGFRTGSMFASVTITRADAKPALDDALRVAQQLARRIGLAQSGALHEQPVPVPATAKQGQAPAGGPPLPALALSAPTCSQGRMSCARATSSTSSAHRTLRASVRRRSGSATPRSSGLDSGGRCCSARSRRRRGRSGSWS